MESAKTILKWLVVLLIVKVTVQITSNYVGYFPADFQTDFLSGRKPQFNIPYAIAFYAHIIASPTTIVSGLLLLNNSFRLRYPTFHRFMGRFHVFAILLLVCPSGLWIPQATHAMECSSGIL